MGHLEFFFLSSLSNKQTNEGNLSHSNAYDKLGILFKLMEKKDVLKAKRKKAALLIQCIARMLIAKECVRRIKHLRRTRCVYHYPNCNYECISSAE